MSESYQGMVRSFFEEDRALITAPAGCGKTEIIADAVLLGSPGRQLVLTHTNAGVAALRKRLARKGAARSDVRVTTIAAWALRFASAYPNISGLTADPSESDDWPETYRSAAKMLSNATIQGVIVESYDGVFVDEYQDCTIGQHELLLELRDLLPVRVVGDPLQAIFGFVPGGTVDWESQVLTAYTAVFELNVPHRWTTTNPDLGHWTVQIRPDLLAGNPLDLTVAPLSNRFARSSRRAIAQHVYTYGAHDELVYIAKRRESARAFARGNPRGRFQSIEEIAGRDLILWAGRFDNTTGIARANEVMEFALATCVKVRVAVGEALMNALKEGREPSRLVAARRPELCSSILAVASSDRPAPIAEMLEAISGLEGIRIYRDELFSEMRRVCSVHDDAAADSLSETARLVRNRTRVLGRRLGKRTAAHTLLIKGLEFEHAIASLADMTPQEQYVAVTRASKSLALIV